MELKQARLLPVAEGELLICAGAFTPDSQDIFHTKTANTSLELFSDWEKINPASGSESCDVLADLRKMRRAREK